MSSAEPFRNYIQYSEVKNILDRIFVLQEKEHFKSLTILSEADGEGKSFFASVLAIAYAERFSKKVLLIDCSEPSREHLARLSSIVSSMDEIDFISLREWSQKQGKNKNGAEEYQLKPLLEQVSGDYDLIILDTSSLARRNRNNLDPILIARQSGAAILITGPTQINPESTLESRKRTTEANIRFLGAIYNHGPKQEGHGNSV